MRKVREWGRKAYNWCKGAALAAAVAISVPVLAPQSAHAQAVAQLDFSPLQAEMDGAKVAILALAPVLLVIWGVIVALKSARSSKGVA